MGMNDTTIDRALWSQFHATNRDRCSTCGNPAVVVVTIAATARKEGEGKGHAGRLADYTAAFCDQHGRDVYRRALTNLRTAPK